jgi:hypothetical protein
MRHPRLGPGYDMTHVVFVLGWGGGGEEGAGQEEDKEDRDLAR